MQPLDFLFVIERKRNQMKNVFLLFALLLAVNIASAQDEITLEPFTKLLVKGNIKLVLVPADQISIDIERGEDHRIEIIQEDEELIIKHREILKYKSYRDFPIEITLAYQVLKQLDARAGARVKSNASISGIRLDIHLGSGAQLDADLQLEKVDVDVAEGARAELTGRVGRFTAIASSGARLKANDMSSEDSRILANTGAIAHVSAFKSLDAQANTGGAIFYQGNPEELMIQEELWGNVSQH